MAIVVLATADDLFIQVILFFKIHAIYITGIVLRTGVI
jgi:hypothetical protein